MNEASAYPDPFAPAHMCVKRCFCGKPTVEDHDFCFCSPECARADAMRALGGNDCHYRKVVRKAYVNSGAPEPAIYRRKSEDHLRRFRSRSTSRTSFHSSSSTQAYASIQKPTVGNQGEGNARKEKVFPTLAQVTSVILARKARHEGPGSPVMADALKANQGGVEISQGAVLSPPSTPTQQTKSGFGQVSTALDHSRGAPRQTAPLKVDRKIAALRKQSSKLDPLMEEVGEENGDRVSFSRVLDRRTEDRPTSPRPQRRICATSIHGSSRIHRSASFAGWDGPLEPSDPVAEEGETLMQLFNQLRDVGTWIEALALARDEKSDRT